MLRRSNQTGCFAAVVLASVLAISVPPATAQAEAAKPVDPTAGDAPARGSLIAGGASPDLFLVYTGDVIGYLDPCG